MIPGAARKLLGVAASASAEEIKAAYRRLALTAHPDQGGSEERFIALKAARDVLLPSELGLVADALLHPRRAFADCIAGRITEEELKRRLAEGRRRLRDLERRVGVRR